MEFALMLVVGVFILVLVSVFANRLGVAAPLILVLVGVGMSFLPWLPADFHIDPWIILVVVLPPLLYSSAVNVPLMDFRRNMRPIGWLSIAQVILTALLIGWILNLLIPDLGFALGVALGAVVSPTDAVAATSIAKRLGLPTRLVTLLEGESLVNDASALVLLRTAVAATAGAVSIWGALGDFLYAAALAIVVGVIAGYVTVWIRSKINDPVLNTALSFVVPFVAYIPAEEFHASGVLAVVVAGLITGHRGARYFRAQDRVSERLNWRTVQFLLENGVFLVMGMQLNSLLGDARAGETGTVWTITIGLIITALLIVLRFLFVTPMIWGLRSEERRAAQMQPRIDSVRSKIEEVDNERWDDARKDRARRLLARRSADLNFLTNEGLGWRGGTVIAWSGMRGVVTLAAAQSLDLSTPHRAELVLIAFTVAFTTLMLQGGTLPWVIRKLGVSGPTAEAEKRELQSLMEEINQASEAALASPELRRPDGKKFSPELLERTRKQMAVRAEWTARVEAENEENGMSVSEEFRALRRVILDAQRSALLDARSTGNYSSPRLASVQHMLDNEDIRLSPGDQAH
ncbi:sodium:proton antiporter [Mycetocola tolaasinivorans]|uniref:Sodium:proton antiporter n=1 Tax=Mycetocola tolaasinivorans TaxID=76635 RepID=A0A3L7A7C0_9MICO|nr:sodium:proton antiporter [Mycetocola tolaasinivorans]RLP76067.1 sodium:proton antiporter [Mycetocola tolaasinivorans]